MTTILIIVGTAVLSSAITAWLTYRVARDRLLPEIERALDQAGSDAARKIGDEVESRVRRGVGEAVANLPSREVLRDTARAARRTGAEILAEGLGRILGPGKR